MDAVTGALIGGALVALIQGAFTYANNRKTTPELTEGKIQEINAASETKQQETMLAFWVEQVERVESKQTTELNGIRSSFDTEKAVLLDRHTKDVQQLRQEAQAEKMASDLFAGSLQTEIRGMITRHAEDRLDFQRQISDLKEDFSTRQLTLEREKTIFLSGMLDRFENFCNNIGGTTKERRRDDTNTTEPNITTESSIVA